MVWHREGTGLTDSGPRRGHLVEESTGQWTDEDPSNPVRLAKPAVERWTTSATRPKEDWNEEKARGTTDNQPNQCASKYLCKGISPVDDPRNNGETEHSVRQCLQTDRHHKWAPVLCQWDGRVHSYFV